MKYILFWLLAVQTATPSAQAQEIIPDASKQTVEQVVSIHGAFDTLLQTYVSDKGVVNYKGLKKEQAKLETYLQTLSDHIPQDSDSRSAQMAYWINAYNAFTLHLIVKNYPVSSIIKLDDGKTWDVKRIMLANKKYSLNKIENDILRPKFKDPRVHFAINCAAKSCPPLYNHAFTEDNLERVLEERTRAFVNDPAFNTISAKSVKLSRIFEWYAADFGNIQAWLNQYSTKKVNAQATVSHFEYNWDLND